MFLLYVLSFFKKGDIIQGNTVFWEGHKNIEFWRYFICSNFKISWEIISVSFLAFWEYLNFKDIQLSATIIEKTEGLFQHM